MAWFRFLFACCLLAILPANASAKHQPQSWKCDVSSVIKQIPVPLPTLAYFNRVQVDVDNMTLTLSICAPDAEGATAENLLRELVNALPRLAQEANLPLKGSLERQIIMVPEGTFPPNVDGRIDLEGHVIELQPDSAATTVVHEGAHFWANNRTFAEPWMVEGYADYLTEIVTGRVKTLPPGDTRCDNVALLTWTYRPPETTICAYVVGSAVFRELAQRVGPDQLSAAIRDLADSPQRVRSLTLLKELERRTQQDLSSIMNERVFPPDIYAMILRHKAAARRLADVNTLAREVGIELPTQVAEALERRQLDHVERWLDRLEPFVQAAHVVAQRCTELALDCERPWQSPPDVDGLEALTSRLWNVPVLLDRYAALQQAAAAHNLQPPAPLVVATARLDLPSLPVFERALALLEGGVSLEAACAQLSEECPSIWRASWSAGDFDRAEYAIGEETGALGMVQQAIARCGTLADACRVIWRNPLRDGQFEPLRGRLTHLIQQLELAPSVELRCETLANVCHQIWQAALRSDQGPGLERALGDLDTLWKRGAALDASCVNVGWPCASLWRSQFGENADPAQALRYQAQIAEALPILAAAARTEQRAPSWFDRLVAMFRSAPASPITQVRTAYQAGDINSARALAQAMIDGNDNAPIDWKAVVLLLLGAGLIAGMFGGVRVLRARRTRAPARPDDSDLLATLLAQPPTAPKQSPPKKLKKVA
jgi:hypothetical protein